MLKNQIQYKIIGALGMAFLQLNIHYLHVIYLSLQKKF